MYIYMLQEKVNFIVLLLKNKLLKCSVSHVLPTNIAHSFFGIVFLEYLFL